MGTLHIGAAGELLVQYRFLKHEIDSARLTTDFGIDLVAYAPTTGRAVTIQVKTGLRPKPSGGRGQPADDWTFPHTSPAELIAFVRLSTDSVWLFTIDEARVLAQQHHPNGNRHIYWYTNEAVASQRRATSLTESDVEKYRFENRVEELFLRSSVDEETAPTQLT